MTAKKSTNTKSTRVEVLKTLKLYIGGKFPRTESGRYYKTYDKKGELVYNACLSSRKDFRNAVVIARKAVADWSSRNAYNRSQILYRIGEILEDRKSLFIDEFNKIGYASAQAEKEVIASIDMCVYYAGWCDKYQQIFSSVNPVASSHFNFSLPENMGVISAFAGDAQPLSGLLGLVLPVVAGGNTIVILASESSPSLSIALAEVLNSSDVPGGVVNILTGPSSEILKHAAEHMDVNGIIYAKDDKKEIESIKSAAALNVKRVSILDKTDWNGEAALNPYLIMDHQEIKTTWHPIGI